MSLGTASCAPAVLETTLAGWLAQVSIVPCTCLVQGLHRDPTETHHKLDWGKGWLRGSISLLVRGTKHLQAAAALPLHGTLHEFSVPCEFSCDKAMVVSDVLGP